MGKKMLCLVLAMLMAVGLFGCSEPSLPKFDLHSSELVGVVEYVEGNVCRVIVSQGDSHYDGPYENSRGEAVEGDGIWVSFTSSDGTVTTGCTIRFAYSYASDVSEYMDDPHITVDSVTVETE